MNRIDGYYLNIDKGKYIVGVHRLKNKCSLNAFNRLLLLENIDR